MRSVSAMGTVHADHTLSVPLPTDIAPGLRAVVVILEDGIITARRSAMPTFSPHLVGPTDPGCTHRREKVYGDDGR